MRPEFKEKLEAKLSAYREWQSRRSFSSARLVQYSGIEMIGAHDVGLSEVENQIEGAISEGFRVEWSEHQGRLYLCVWEGPPHSPPPWDCVFHECAAGLDFFE